MMGLYVVIINKNPRPQKADGDEFFLSFVYCSKDFIYCL